MTQDRRDHRAHVINIGCGLPEERRARLRREYQRLRPSRPWHLEAHILSHYGGVLRSIDFGRVARPSATASATAAAGHSGSEATESPGAPSTSSAVSTHGDFTRHARSSCAERSRVLRSPDG